MGNKRAAVGVDVGGTKTLCLLVNGHGETLASVKFKTAPAEGRAKFTRSLTQAAGELKAAAKKRGLKIAAAGIGCAGQVDERELRIIQSPNALCLEDYPIGKHLRKVLGAEVTIANDVQMGVYGEYRLGAARGAANVLGVFFGTGVGGAAIIDHHLYRGASGVGGQVGSVLAQPVGGPRAALSHGIVDRIASKAAIAGEALVMAVKQWAPYLHRKAGTDISRITWGLLDRAIRRGDKQVEEMLRARMRVVGIALSSVVNFLNPNVVVLGGGLVEAMPRLTLKELEGGLREYLAPEVSEPLSVRVAQLKGEAVALGAACDALEKFAHD